MLGERDGVFHNASEDEADGVDDDQVYIDIGREEEWEVDAELEHLVNQAMDWGLSKKVRARLRTLLQDNRIFFLFRLGKTDPANVAPMKIDLDETKTSILFRARRYSAP